MSIPDNIGDQLDNQHENHNFLPQKLDLRDIDLGVRDFFRNLEISVIDRTGRLQEVPVIWLNQEQYAQRKNYWEGLINEKGEEINKPFITIVRKGVKKGTAPDKRTIPWMKKFGFTRPRIFDGTLMGYEKYMIRQSTWVDCDYEIRLVTSYAIDVNVFYQELLRDGFSDGQGYMNINGHQIRSVLGEPSEDNQVADISDERVFQVVAPLTVHGKLFDPSQFERKGTINKIVLKVCEEDSGGQGLTRTFGGQSSNAPFTTGCDPANIYDFNGALLASVAAGASYNVAAALVLNATGGTVAQLAPGGSYTITSGASSTVFNSTGDTLAILTSGNDYVVTDSNILDSTGGTVGTVVAQGTFVVPLSIVRDYTGGTLSQLNPSGIYDVPASTVLWPTGGTLVTLGPGQSYQVSAVTYSVENTENTIFFSGSSNPGESLDITFPNTTAITRDQFWNTLATSGLTSGAENGVDVIIPNNCYELQEGFVLSGAGTSGVNGTYLWSGDTYNVLGTIYKRYYLSGNSAVVCDYDAPFVNFQWTISSGLTFLYHTSGTTSAQQSPPWSFAWDNSDLSYSGADPLPNAVQLTGSCNSSNPVTLLWASGGTVATISPGDSFQLTAATVINHTGGTVYNDIEQGQTRQLLSANVFNYSGGTLAQLAPSGNFIFSGAPALVTVENSNQSYSTGVTAPYTLSLPDIDIYNSTGDTINTWPSVSAYTIPDFVVQNIDGQSATTVYGSVVAVSFSGSSGGGSGSTITANFSADSTSVTIDDDVTFTDLSSGSTDNPDTWTYSFGDGRASCLQNPTTRYSVGGTFSPRLFAGNLSSSVAGLEQKSDYITVQGLAEAYTNYEFGPALFKLASGQTNCVEVYHTVSATTQTIGFGEDNWIDIEAIESFANGSQVKIQRVYHPSDSSKDCVQLTPANMPPITDASGNIYLNDSGKPEWRCTGSEFWTISNYNYFTAGNMYFQGIVSNISSGIMVSHYDSTTSDRSYLFYIRTNTTPRFAAVYSSNGSSVAVREAKDTIPEGLQIVQMHLKLGEATDSNRWKLWQNGEQRDPNVIVGAISGSLYVPSSTNIVVCGSGSGGESGSFNGNASALLIFTGDNESDVPALADNFLRAGGIYKGYSVI